MISATACMPKASRPLPTKAASQSPMKATIRSQSNSPALHVYRVLAAASVMLAAASSQAANPISAQPVATTLNKGDQFLIDCTNAGAGTFTTRRLDFTKMATVLQPTSTNRVDSY